MNAQMRALRDASYERLVASRRLGGALVRTREPKRVHAALVRIVANGRKTLEEAGAVADPYLLSHTRMYLAAAHFDLAGLETKPERRAMRVEIASRHCVASVRTALASRTPFLSLIVLPWAMVVLAGGLRRARGAQRLRLQKAMASCANALPTLERQKIRDQRYGARLLFRGQLLLVGAESVGDRRQRAMVLRRALEIVRDARRRLLGAGDFVAGRQAKATIARIEKLLA